MFAESLQVDSRAEVDLMSDYKVCLFYPLSLEKFFQLKTKDWTKCFRSIKNDKFTHFPI